MRNLALILCLAAWTGPAAAQPALGAVAARSVPAGTVLTAADLTLGLGGIDPALAIGQQTRVALYEGRAIGAGHLTRPTLISRNQVVTLRYESAGLRIETEGRALGEGAAGEVVRVMNLSSRAMLNARINPDGTLSVAER
ncbi:flagellar basal body P-ring formation chaperone FlgA [Paracoccus sp. Z118]|uniref:flagellar basal body P-ring formation chaperone FlgA n=1 Tax=Paracoccus sp. Z118 TaxID=2851017 RepID=UPI001C2C545A|nr:flagellar basal body P-ring formation chaperone FlgA [Paracoccus sp. Z118]MBV0891812.1 flagellar basal body P-ring formation chaperone FlgA [Paracoccus sp. Z118]